MPFGIGPICRSPSGVTTLGNSRPNGPRSVFRGPGIKPAGSLNQLVAVVRWIRPTPLSPSTASRSRFSGHSICSMLSLNTRMRASTDGF